MDESWTWRVALRVVVVSFWKLVRQGRLACDDYFSEQVERHLAHPADQADTDA